MRVIDSHIHCGVQNVSQAYEHIALLLSEAGIEAACMFAPVEDIYYRYDRQFDDNAAWRACRLRAHHYLLGLAAGGLPVYPYHFVWNDFEISDLDDHYYGIKWHHHAGEPPYRYDDPRCADMLDAICERKLPIVLEETFAQTLTFLERVAERTPVIIPHLGLLNGGYDALHDAGIWHSTTVYADTALAGPREISHFAETYGVERLLFGSDYPFGNPAEELTTVRRVGFSADELDLVCAGNILRLQAARCI